MFNFDKVKKAARLQYPPHTFLDAGPTIGSRLYEALPSVFPVVTYSIVLLSAVLFYLGDIHNLDELHSLDNAQQRKYDLGFRTHFEILLSSPWGLVTSAVFHGGMIHVFFNCIIMLNFGVLLERGIGSLKTLVFYLFLAVITSGYQVLVSTAHLLPLQPVDFLFIAKQAGIQSLPNLFGASLGLSGILYGILGFMWGSWKRWTGFLIYFNRRNLNFFLGWLVLCFVLTYAGVPIANTAHLTGLIMGFFIGMWSCYSIREAKLWFALTLAMLGLMAGGLLLYHWRFQQTLEPFLQFL